MLAGAALSDHVAPYMVKKFTAVSPKAGRSEVLDLMQARTLSQIPIVDAQGKLVGLHLLREILAPSNGRTGPWSWPAGGANACDP